jgi:hypothetical protein
VAVAATFRVLVPDMFCAPAIALSGVAGDRQQ